MTKRKPLPYTAIYNVDMAMAENADATKSLVPLINDKQISTEERYRLIGMALHHINKSTSFLRDAKDTKETNVSKE